jgi:hypothetical protein
MTSRRDILILAAGAPWLLCAAGARAAAPPMSLYGRRIVHWRAPQQGAGARLVAPDAQAPFAGPGVLQLAAGSAPALAEQAVGEGAPYLPQGSGDGFSIGIWGRNPGPRTLDFELRVLNAEGSHYVKWHGALDPGGWTFLTFSPTQQIAAGWLPGRDAIAAVRIAQEDGMGEGPWRAGDTLLFGDVFADVRGRSLFLLTFDDGFASQVRAAAGGGRSGREIVEAHGFRGSLFLVPAWLGTSGKYGVGGGQNSFMTPAEARALRARGWSVGSHSHTHPASADNAGLRLLGPYGYYLSNPVDHLPALYVATWELNEKHRRRAVRATVAGNVLAFEHPHQFLVNMPIEFTDAAPPGFRTGTVYYCQSTPERTTATFATDQGSLQQTVAVTADWTGLANYRYPGSAGDESAIYADIVAGIRGLAELGLPGGERFFALPQGSADSHVRAACIRAGLGWVRGASRFAHTIAVGRPSGGGLSNVANHPGGWLAQPDCIQTDALSPAIADIRAYIDQTVRQGACGCAYHHAVGGSSARTLEQTCAWLKERAGSGAIEVVTLEGMAAALARP